MKSSISHGSSHSLCYTDVNPSWGLSVIEVQPAFCVTTPRCCFVTSQIHSEKRGCTIQQKIVNCEILLLKLSRLIFAQVNPQELNVNMRLVILCQIAFVSALKWDGPKSTRTFITASSNPRPTDTTAELIKRDAWPVSYCGFAGGIECKISTSLHFLSRLTITISSLGSHLLLTFIMRLEYGLFCRRMLRNSKQSVLVLYFVHR
jgi:hypothetical protein